MKNRTITVRDTEVSISTRHEQDYISLTDMVGNFDGGSALIEQWLKNKDTVLLLGVWEQLNNPGFNSLEFEGIKNEAGRNSFFLSAKKWIDATAAIGLHARAGRYDGTYAHKDIAFEFGSWLSPEFKLYLIKEFQHLKDEEARSQARAWNFQRTLAKVNYKIHTDAIKEPGNSPEHHFAGVGKVIESAQHAPVFSDLSIRETVSPELSWPHYNALARIENFAARDWYTVHRRVGAGVVMNRVALLDLRMIRQRLTRAKN